MHEINLGYLLDEDAPPQPPITWPLKRWAAVARDRIGDIGAVTRLQRANAHGFYADTTIYIKRGADWIEEFGNGHRWPQPPDAPRPSEGRPIWMMTNITGTSIDGGPRNVAFVAGVATTAVTRLRVESAIEEHDVHVEARTGAFVVLTLHGPDATTFRLVALDASGREIDRIDYRDPWSGSD